VRVTEIEFLDPGAGTGPSSGADRAATREDWEDDRGATELRHLVPALAAAVCWLIAAGLAVMASLSTVYRLVYDSGNQHQTISVDAWGRFNTSELAQTLGHQTRYAVVAIGAAVLLMGAAIVAIARLAVARYLAVAGTAVAGALTTTLLLFVAATRSTNATRARQLATNFRLQTESGAAVWLGLAATAAAAVGIVLAFVLKSPPIEPDEPGLGLPPEPGSEEPTAFGAPSGTGEPARQSEGSATG
jgi:hypothetical protein